jgi:CRISPR type II-A-associated protein Csn2
MKMVMFPNEPIEIKKGLNFVNFQNAIFYWKWINALQTGEKIVFSDDDKIINIDKAIIYLGGLENDIDFTKLYAKSINNLVAKYTDEEKLLELTRHQMAIKTIFQQVFMENDLPLLIDSTWDFEQLIKVNKIQIDSLKIDSAYDKIINMVHVMSEFSEQRVLVLNNIHLYLNPMEISNLHELNLAYDMKILSLGLATSSFKKAGEAYQEIFFDEDFVQFGSD